MVTWIAPVITICENFGQLLDFVDEGSQYDNTEIDGPIRKILFAEN